MTINTEAVLKNHDLPHQTPPTINSSEILRGHKSVWIEHQGVRYRLQQTQLGKLILTK